MATSGVSLIIFEISTGKLFVLAARRGSPVGPIVRAWIVEKLRESER
jgi:hypothetical protein